MESGPHEVTLNGSHGEGGSALLRTALAMSALTQTPVRLHDIRGATRKPGITSEDLTFVRALAASCSADCVGDELGESDLRFSPTSPVRALNLRTSISQWEKGNVPGSALVVLESLLPVLARAGAYSRVSVEGETYNRRALTYDSFDRVTLAAHRAQGIYAAPTLHMAGFGFGARGQATLEVEPSAPQALEWAERGELVGLRARVVLGQLKPEIGERATDRLFDLFQSGDRSIEVEVAEVDTRSPGMFVTLWAEFERGIGCGTAMGEPGVRVERIVERAAEQFSAWFDSNATVDPYVADQVLLPAALAEGKTSFTTNMITRRLITITWIIKQFLPIHLTLIGHEGGFGEVTIQR